MKKAFIISSLLAPVFASILLAIHFSIIFFSPYSGETQNFTVRPGEGFSSVNGRLHQKGIISEPRLFHYYAKYTDKMSSIKAGTYKIEAGQHMGEVLSTLVDGVPLLTKITIPEGKNLFQIGELLEKNEITTYEEFVKACRSKEMIDHINIDAPSVEGYLFPETYMFAPKTPAKEVVLTMLNQFKKKTKGLDLRVANLSAHEVIILASIVEKETGAKFERATIAGVYHNRLNKKMRLQADPTTIYGIWEDFDGNLRKKHLLEKTDYNTYKIPALPLGPIANPSFEAIKATLHPEEHSYIYFVSKNDGTHVFSTTYKEHLKAVEYWQKNPAMRKGRSWRDLKQ